MQRLPLAGLASETTAPEETIAETISTQPVEAESVGETVPLETPEETLSQEPVMAISGKCGDNLTWQLTNGTLTIKGTGDMSYRSTKAHILGGAGFVKDEVARKAMNLPDDYVIEKLQ